MNRKLLNEANILNELKGGSSFFNRTPDSPVVAVTPETPVMVAPMLPKRLPPIKVETPPSVVETSGIGQPKEPTRKGISPSASIHAGTNASTQASYADGLVDDIRKIVKTTGKEVSFVRLTSDEKKQLVDIVYTYKSQGVKTSETEINRIAVNFMLEDYKANGAESILAKVIAALLVTWRLNSAPKNLSDAFDCAMVSDLPSLAWRAELCAVESRNRFV